MSTVNDAHPRIHYMELKDYEERQHLDTPPRPRNPLHGVERLGLLGAPSLIGSWIHYMELKGRILEGEQLWAMRYESITWSWKLIDYYGIKRGGKTRIHYMELKAKVYCSGEIPPELLNPLHGVERSSTDQIAEPQHHRESITWSWKVYHEVSVMFFAEEESITWSWKFW